MAKNEKPDWRLLHNEAWEYKQEGKLKKAKEGYYKALEIHPNYNSYFNLGEVYASMGDRKKSIFYYDKSLELNPEYASAYNNKAFSYYMLEAYDLALENINKAILLDKKDGIAHATKAEILFALHDEEGFYKSFETCIYLGVDPSILDKSIKKKYGNTKRYKLLIGTLQEEALSIPEVKKICTKIETWDAIEIKEAMALLKTKKEYHKTIENRYGQIYKNLGGKTLRSLAGFPSKWDKLTNIKKCNILTYWPTSAEFPIPLLDLSGTKRVDSWRYAHYGKQIEHFPENLNKIKGIRMVYLKHQQLEEVPEFVFYMKDLEVLDLRDNELNAIPEKLLALKKLKVLNLNYNYGLTEIPDVGQLKNLKELNVKYTDIQQLSEAFFELKNLKKIDTSNSDLDRDTAIIKRILTTFPNIELLSNAKEAVLLEENENPDEYKGKENIKLREFNLNYLPKSLFNADCVKELSIDCYHLKELPNTFDRLQTLEVLHLKVGKEITSIPTSITSLKKLKELSIEGWKISTLPENLIKLQNLEHLKLNCHGLTTLPKSIFALKNLTHFEIEGAQKTIIPKEVDGLANLETLYLTDIFQLTIHPSIETLNSLKDVKIEIRNMENFNGLLKLPKTLNSLRFKYHKYRRNDMGYEVSLGTLLHQLKNLKKLELRGVDIQMDAVEIPKENALQNLFIDGKLETLHDSFGNLKALSDLTFFNSAMETLNASLYECSNLAYCRITDTKFTTIPPGISKMKKLSWFGFETSAITAIPEDIFELQQLKRLVLGDCPLFQDKAFKAKIKRKIKGLKVNKSWY